MAGYPQIRSFATTAISSASTTSHVCTQPASIVNGDLLVAIFSGRSATTTITPPAGWTTKYSNLAATNDRWIVAYKYAASESGTYTFTTTATGSVCTIFAIRGAHPSTPFDVAAYSRQTNTSVSYPTLTPSVAATLGIWFGNWSTGTANFPVNWPFYSSTFKPDVVTRRISGTGGSNGVTQFIGIKHIAAAAATSTANNVGGVSSQNLGMVFNIVGTDNTVDATAIDVKQGALLVLGKAGSPTRVHQGAVLVLKRDFPKTIFTEHETEWKA